jgi:hypothetical protein
MSLLMLFAAWIVLSLIATAGMALVCHGGAQEDRARALLPVALPAPRAAADDRLPAYSSGPSQSLTHR